MDKKKIENLYKANYRRLLLIANSILGDVDDSRDAVNEVFSNLLSTEVMVKNGDEQKFLATCVRNVSLNMMKHKNVHERFARMTFMSDNTDYSNDEYWKDAASEVMSIVNNQFSERMKQIFNLRFKCGLKYDEIAAELGIARMTVYKDLFRCVDLIKAKVKI